MPRSGAFIGPVLGSRTQSSSVSSVSFLSSVWETWHHILNPRLTQPQDVVLLMVAQPWSSTSESPLPLRTAHISVCQLFPLPLHQGRTWDLGICGVELRVASLLSLFVSFLENSLPMLIPLSPRRLTWRSTGPAPVGL